LDDSTPQENAKYRSFLVRLSKIEDQPSWRVSVFDPVLGTRFEFNNIHALMQFLLDMTGPHEGSSKKEQ
jgi:hypothetical protein